MKNWYFPFTDVSRRAISENGNPNNDSTCIFSVKSCHTV